MLKKTQRLPAGNFLQTAKVINSPFFTLKIAENDSKKNRYGFIVSKKVDKRAVGRNRTKRIFRACIEKLLERIRGGYDMRFTLKKTTSVSFSGELCPKIEEVLTREGLLK